MFRDGGSYYADFLINNDSIYTVFLQRSKMPDEKGVHHKWLFEFFKSDFDENLAEVPKDCLPIVTGSKQE